MADVTGIEWTDSTWNPMRGCTRISEGCRHCYAEQIAARFSDEDQVYHGFAERMPAGSRAKSWRPRWTGRVEMIPGQLDKPFGWRRPRRIFVNSMSDTFHEALPDQDIAIVFGHAIAAHHVRGHVFQILTKRAERMRTTLSAESPWFWLRAHEIAQDLVREHSKTGATDRVPEYGLRNPPPGIWLGVSAEDQDAADERIPHLLATPAAVRFVSYEPALGPLDLTRIKPGSWGDGSAINALAGSVTWWGTPAEPETAIATNGQRIAWVIAGGESSTGARDADPAWFRAVRDQCRTYNTAFFMKQMGGRTRPLPPIPADLQIREMPHA